MSGAVENISKSIKIGVALGSGGAKGCAHIGVLKALEELGIKPSIVTGCSMGAIVGSCYSLGISVKELENRVLKINMLDIIDLRLPSTYGFVKGDKAEKVIREFLKIEKQEQLKFTDCIIPFGCVATDIAEGELVNITKGNLIPAVRASFSICGVFYPVKIGKRKLSDGGALCRVPIDLAKKMGADIVIGVDCVGETLPEDMGDFKYLDTVIRVFSIMDYKVSKPEMGRADLLISISQPDVSQIRVKNIEASIMYGYNAVMQNKDKILSLVKGS